MRLIERLPNGNLLFQPKGFNKVTPPYAILSHTWGDESEEVTYEDMVEGTGRDKAGFAKIKFCGEQAERDGLQYFWVDSCCIKKSSDAELSESLNSMFRWYKCAVKCYVYLSDVAATDGSWKQAFRKSRWFTRGWTLQELLAPSSLEFFGQDVRLGDRQSLLYEVHEITRIPIPALQGDTLSQYNSDQVFAWAKYRQTSREEDWVYSLLGILGISMPIIYGEGRTNATRRLKREIDDSSIFPVASCTADYRELIEPMSTLVEGTKHTFLSDNITLQRQLARVYAELAEQRDLLGRLSSLVQEKRSRQHEPVACKRCGEKCSKTQQSESTSASIFFNCVSRFSSNGVLSNSINGLCTKFSGNPAYVLERNTSFHPETYVREGFFANPISVLAIKQSSSDDQLAQHYYLLYAQPPHSWYWVIVSATFVDGQAVTGLAQAPIPGSNDTICKLLPNAISDILRKELPRLQLYSSVSRISLYLDSSKASRSTRLLQIKSTEDITESERTQEEELLHYVDIDGCQRFRESQIQVLDRLSSACFAVKLAGQNFVERKRPFAYAGWNDESGLEDFMDDLKLRISLQGCRGVAQFIGVVTDDSGIRLRSFLYEAPMANTLHEMFYIANSKSEIIPWSIRELWAQQIAQAIADIHSKGITIGILDRNNIGLRTDGSAMLYHSNTPRRTIFEDEELVPPEFLNPDGDAPQQQYNDRTDMYQFGRYLWLLAEHRGNTRGLRCSRNACISVPRYQCTADHADRAHLPPVSVDVPSYFSKIILQCRSTNAKERPTARRISDLLASRCQLMGCSPEMLVFLNTFIQNVPFMVHCTECGVRAFDTHFHCYVCDLGNFDLCAACVGQGIHCRIAEHVLVVRKTTNEGIAHVT